MSAIPVTQGEPGAYPANLNVDYPDKPLNRLTSFFRGFTIIPIAIVLGLLAGAYIGSDTGEGWHLWVTGWLVAGGHIRG